MIRQAKFEDQHEIAELSYIIWEDMELPIVKKFEKSQVISWLEQAITKVPYRTFYENVLVYEIDGDVAGIIVTYKGEDEMHLEKNWLKLDLPEKVRKIGTPLPLKESKDDELYIETVAVFPQYRGKGIATQLMHYIIEEHRDKKLSLSCDYENNGAYQLYQRLGFETEGTIDLYGHEYRHMIINKKNAEQ